MGTSFLLHLRYTKKYKVTLKQLINFVYQSYPLESMALIKFDR
jgi:hypothetical protein